ncbi:MAG TPA: GMC family oxidoreductase N-terminal domain-containing protein, partial [Pirellulaceae bacterium]|nr:GMC family oxidoreductase N-terminal domain-containing protein [Pirellulaceae bacterium]
MSTNDFDVLVVGSGAGGGMLAQACARAGKRVGVLERGEWPDERDQDEQSTLIDRRPYDDREYEMNGAETRLYAGGVVGGGTSVYGGALIRASREDFRPGRHYGDRLAQDLWDWPISYDDLEPFYDEAERLLHVTGRRSDDFGPLAGPVNRLDADPFPLTKINHQLVEANRQRGLHPQRHRRRLAPR